MISFIKGEKSCQQQPKVLCPFELEITRVAENVVLNSEHMKMCTKGNSIHNWQYNVNVYKIKKSSHINRVKRFRKMT